MPYLRDRAIVLKKEPFREQDRRYLLYGREHGLLSAVARGASIPRSKQAGHLEPFSEVDVMIAKGVAFDKLAVAKRVGIAQDFPLSGYVVAGAVCDLVGRLTRPGIIDDRIFFFLQDVLMTLSGMRMPPTPERARLLYASATLRLLDYVGFAPPIEGALLKFMRQAPFRDILRITATREAFGEASAFVEDALTQTPLSDEPHGARTIQRLLG